MSQNESSGTHLRMFFGELGCFGNVWDTVNDRDSKLKQINSQKIILKTKNILTSTVSVNV